jgi:putative transposase
MKIRPISINRKKISWLLEQELDIKLEALNHHLDITRMLINDILEDEMLSFTGPRYSHQKPHDSKYSRWGFNPGSVKIGDRKIKVDVPRIYDKEEKRNISLENYSKMKELEAIDDRLLKAIILGLSTRDYNQVVGNLMDSFGLSHSSVSSEFIEKSSKKLESFENRDLSIHSFVSIFIDGKYLAKEQIIIALGITDKGDKIPLGFIQSTTENSTSIKQFLSRLIERGLYYEEGLLFVIDGSKGILKAIQDTFGDYAVIQRCQWHKRENIISYLNENIQDSYRRRINAAYRSDKYEEAKQLLDEIHRDLKVENLSAARSLKEGLDETLTLHRLGLITEFGRSFSTTNCIESINSLIEKYLKKVKYWQNSSQRHRWVACALLEIEQRMRKVNNYKNLSKMKSALRKEMVKREKIVREVA